MDAIAIIGKSSKSILIFIILTIVLLMTKGCSSGEDPTTTLPPPITITDPPATAETTDQILDGSLTSNYNSETYPFTIFLPAVFETDKNLPVIYLTDGLYLFEILLQKSKEIGLQAIIVAIGDKEGTDPDRVRDYSPSFCGASTIDGFDNYYNLITQQLVPFVDENYENDRSSRSLIGYSFGGRFAVAALLMENPEAVIFHSSIAVDPAFGCAGDSFSGLINELDDLIISANSVESFKLFRTRSSAFELNGFNEYMGAQDMDLPWFDFGFIELLNEDHESVVGPSLAAGLRYVYDIN